MAQQFVLKGVNRLVDYTSTDGTFTFAIKNDPRGGDTWQIPQWWAKKANNTIYNSCTVIDMIGTDYLMVIPTSVDTQLMVTYDDDIYDLTFSNFDSVDRIAITGKDTKKIVIEYLLPSISGGAVAKRILQPAATIGDFTITGKGKVDTGTSSSYQSNATPTVDDETYAWTVKQGGSVVPSGEAEVTSGQTASGCTIAWKTAGTYDVVCEISSDTASVSPVSDTKEVVCTTVYTVGSVSVSGNSSTPAEKATTYTATVTGGNVNDTAYQWSCVDATAQIANPNGSSSTFTFDAEGNATVQCVVSSATAGDSDSDTEAVTVTTAKKIGTCSISHPAGDVTPGVPTNFQVDMPNSNVNDATYQWSTNPTGGVTINDATAEATNITFTNANTYEVKCIVSSATASDTPQTATDSAVDVVATAQIGNVTIPSGPSLVDTLNVGKNYTAQISGDATGLTYVWSSTPSTGASITDNSVNPVQVVFTQEGDYTIECEVKSGAASDSPQFGSKNTTVDTSGA